MPPKRPAPPKPSPASDELTDEWGIYDPEKAGIPALLKRLGRPVLRAAPTSTRRDRRRGVRPERSAEGVGLALREVQRRAGLLPEEDPSLATGNPARAMRFALKARAAADHAVAPYVPPPAEVEAPPVPEVHEAPPVAAAVVEMPAAPPAPAARKRARKAVAAESAAPVVETTPPPVVEPPAVAARPRGRKGPARGRARAVAAAPPAPPAPEAAPVQNTPAIEARAVPGAPAETPRVSAPAVKVTPAVKAGPPAPSPRRPRGPVPLAAWAHAVADTPRQPARRVDPRGFWRGLFRIPAEVALVEYAHGCRIHRLLVETGDDHAPDFI